MSELWRGRRPARGHACSADLRSPISLHAPGVGRPLVDAEWLAGAGDGLLPVNTARADLVDEPALAEALRTGRIAGYAADTLDTESTGAGSPLLAEDLADRVVLTPHIGARTVEAIDRMGSLAVVDLLAVLGGDTPKHPVRTAGGPDGVDARRVVLAHADRNPDPGLQVELAQRGAYLGYDGMARHRERPDSALIELIAALCAEGMAGHLLLGGDVARRSRYVGYGGMPGLAYLPDRFLPRLRTRLGPEVVRQIMVDAPAGALTWSTTG
ncbi:NAD(P)-dependent oxidoreductase [Plantactinospora sp. KLBMP9567]|uniref:phosphotriesterase family protein n=1 Tax=Plantactinospora sp. KLBMP9567 TaxID=3085900 RepID=UPI002982B0C0|nr:NAD(P)-dependent oxidoreductase [Plantactinospora sp. KLBMP9567]MDW5323648.1 NAD(P)-dependent oxidoreductase [Plantactinospora sp. KLBMP9567]